MKTLSWMVVMAVLVVAGWTWLHARTPAAAGARKGRAPLSTTRYAPPTPAALAALDPMARQVTQHEGTEPPFRNAFHDHHVAGIYVDITTGEPLFSSTDKFDSGTGWPSFTQPIEDGRVLEKRDVTFGMVRVEVRSSAGNAHLGHVFEDGPAPTGLRYCINSAALRFVPTAKLAAEGYGPYAALFGEAPTAAAAPAAAPGATEQVLLAGGCFWGMEELLRAIPGVVTTEVGYTGGTTANPGYDTVHTGETGHAEAVRVVFDPKRLSLEDLLENGFFRMHDPTTANRQGNDVGSQYRSAIFFASPAQQQAALRVMKRVEASGRWKKPLTTQVAAAGPFTPAEDYHQDYLQKHPDGYTCHYMRD